MAKKSKGVTGGTLDYTFTADASGAEREAKKYERVIDQAARKAQQAQDKFRQMAKSLTAGGAGSVRGDQDLPPELRDMDEKRRSRMAAIFRREAYRVENAELKRQAALMAAREGVTMSAGMGSTMQRLAAGAGIRSMAIGGLGAGAVAAALAAVDTQVGAGLSADRVGRRFIQGADFSGANSSTLRAAQAMVQSAELSEKGVGGSIMGRIPVLGERFADALDRARNAAQMLASTHQELVGSGRGLAMMQAGLQGDSVGAARIGMEQQVGEADLRVRKALAALDEVSPAGRGGARASETYLRGMRSSDPRFKPFYAAIDEAREQRDRLRDELAPAAIAQAQAASAAELGSLRARGRSARLAGDAIYARAGGDELGALKMDMERQAMETMARQAAELAQPMTPERRKTLLGVHSDETRAMRAGFARELYGMTSDPAAAAVTSAREALGGAFTQGQPIEQLQIVAEDILTAVRELLRS